VIDDRARDGMIEAGMSTDQVFVTGHPGLERTRASLAALTEDDRRRLRKERGLRDDALVIAFFSEPFFMGPGREFYSGPGAIMMEDGRGRYGYTVEDILPAVSGELEAALCESGGEAELVLRPHPAEDPGTLEALSRTTGDRLHASLDTAGSAMSLIALCDVAMGMMTIALLQAALAGRPAISVQIGLGESDEEDPCVSNSLGYTLGIYDRPTLTRACRLIARRDWDALRPRPTRELAIAGAAGRVADVLIASARLRPAASPDRR
jgi:hypothetical protein